MKVSPKKTPNPKTPKTPKNTKHQQQPHTYDRELVLPSKQLQADQAARTHVSKRTVEAAFGGP
jgi:hypothetical protein